MTLTEKDIQLRRPVWESMQMLFMDIDPAEILPQVAATCARSTYTLEELKAIFLREIFPACRFNLFGPAPEWRGFEVEDLTARILRKQRHRKPVPLLPGRLYSKRLWIKLEDEVRRQRALQQ